MLIGNLITGTIITAAGIGTAAVSGIISSIDETEVKCMSTKKARILKYTLTGATAISSFFTTLIGAASIYAGCTLSPEDLVINVEP